MRYVIGNAAFGILATAWAVYFRRDVEIATAGVIVVLVSFIAGTCIGYALHVRRGTPLRAAYPSRRADASAFERIVA